MPQLNQPSTAPSSSAAALCSAGARQPRQTSQLSSAISDGVGEILQAAAVAAVIASRLDAEETEQLGSFLSAVGESLNLAALAKARRKNQTSPT